MAAEAEPSAWDFFTLAAWWNLYGLPALLVLVALAVAIRRRILPTASSKREPS